MAIYAVVAVFELGGRNLLYSMDRRRALIACSGAMMLVNVVLKIWLLPAIGPAGAVISTDIAYLACMIIPYLWIAHRIVHHAPRHDPLGGAQP